MFHHSHVGSDTPELRLGKIARALLLIIVIGTLAVTVLGLIRLWPSKHTEGPGGADTNFSAPGATFPKASVESVFAFACPTGADDSSDGSDTGSPGGVATSTAEATCAHVHVRLLEGSDKGTSTVVDVAPAIAQSRLSRGDTIQVLRVPPGEGQPASYSYSNTSRGLPLLLLTISFAIIVIGVARLKGLLSLIVIVGPNRRPTRAEPSRWEANSATMITAVIGTMNRSMLGSTTLRPSTADSTEIAGVIHRVAEEQ